MGIIIALCVNWFAAGLVAALAIMATVDKNYGLSALNACLFLFNSALGVFNFYRLLSSVQFIAEVVK